MYRAHLVGITISRWQPAAQVHNVAKRSVKNGHFYCGAQQCKRNSVQPFDSIVSDSKADNRIPLQLAVDRG